MAEFPVTKPELIVPSCVNLSTYIQGMSDYEVRCYYTQLVQQWAIEWGQTQQDWKTQQEAFESFKTYVNNKIAEFQKWFDNLDVQNEINNKLDDMIQDGTLSKIVAGVLDGKYQPIVVSSTSDMTDHDTLYILSGNGHVYQWTGSAFTDTAMVYDMPKNNYAYIGSLPAGTNLRNPVGLATGAYTFNIDNLTETPDGFSGQYGVYYLLYRSSTKSSSGILMDLYGNTWLVQPNIYYPLQNQKFEDLNNAINGCYKYNGKIPQGTNLDDMGADFARGWYNFTSSEVTGLPDNFTDDYGYVEIVNYTSPSTHLYILVDLHSNMWINESGGYVRVNSSLADMYLGGAYNADTTDILPRNSSGKLYTTSDANTGLPNPFAGNNGYIYNLYSNPTAKNVFQILAPSFHSASLWFRTQLSDGWVQLGPDKQSNREKIAFIGDSITEKNFRADVNYVDLIEDWSGCTVQNLGDSGCGFAAGDSPFINKVNDIDSDVTLVCVCCSFNDLNKLPLGEVTDATDTTLCGCMNMFYDALFAKLPLVRVVAYTTNAWSGARPGNSSAESYVDAFKTISENRCIPFTPVWKMCNLRPWITEQQKAYFTAPGGRTDQTHPNDAGHKLLAPIIYESIIKTVPINI